MLDAKRVREWSPETFLGWEHFENDFDRMGGMMEDGRSRDQFNADQYANGLKYGRNSHFVFVMVTGCWGASLKSGGQVTSYEIIGICAGTHQFWKGVLDSGVKIIIYRDDNGIGTTIRESM